MTDVTFEGLGTQEKYVKLHRYSSITLHLGNSKYTRTSRDRLSLETIAIIYMLTDLSWKTTCLQRLHFLGRIGGLSRLGSTVSTFLTTYYHWYFWMDTHYRCFHTLRRKLIVLLSFFSDYFRVFWYLRWSWIQTIITPRPLIFNLIMKILIGISTTVTCWSCWLWSLTCECTRCWFSR